MLWVKSFHVIAVMAWMAGVFYLPRIFVHYAEGLAAGEDVRRLVIMARRLFGFMTVMALIAIVLGLWMWLGFHDGGRWLMMKMVFVLALLGYHGLCRVLLGRVQRGVVMPTPLQLRLINEAPLLLVVPVVILAVMKPF
jgi:protoporphyrinogen IX oxidase